MNVKSQKQEKNILELTVDISLDEMLVYLEKTAEKISESLKIPGFRNGKAPLSVVIKQVGEMQVWQEAADMAINKTIDEAVKTAEKDTNEKLEIFGIVNVDLEKLAPNNPLVYKAKIALLPKVELPDLEKIKVKPKEVVVKEEKLNKTLENLLEMQAKEVLEDKAAENGDRAEIDLSLSRDNVPLENGSYKKFNVIIGKKQMIPGFEENLIGLKKDEEKIFKLKFPKDYFEKKLADKEVDFKVKINGVYKRTIPELNDDYAKKLGFQTLEDLKNTIKKDLEHEELHKRNNELEKEILNKIMEQTKFEDLPEVMIEQETRKMLNELKQGVQEQGIKFEDYIAQLKKNESDLRLDFAPDAVKRLKASMIVREIAKNDAYKVSDEELHAEIEKTKKMYPGNPQVEENSKSPEFLNYLRNVMANNKVLDMLMEKIAGISKPATEEHDHCDCENGDCDCGDENCECGEKHN